MRLGLKGYTIVEIATILVIIGVMITLALKGQQLITSARIKLIRGDVDRIQAAVYAFQNKYKALPGDRADDTVANWGWHGNGNGAMGDDRVLFWKDLYRAEILAGDYTASSEADLAMKNPYDGQYMVSRYNSRDAVMVTNIPGKIAWAIDNEFDEGVWNQGTIRSSAEHKPDTDERITMYWYVF